MKELKGTIVDIVAGAGIVALLLFMLVVLAGLSSCTVTHRVVIYHTQPTEYYGGSMLMDSGSTWIIEPNFQEEPGDRQPDDLWRSVQRDGLFIDPTPSALTVCQHKKTTTFLIGTSIRCHCLDCGEWWNGECQ